MIGYTTVRCLPDLEGKKWGPVTQAYLRALRPSRMRVVESGGSIKTDSIAWRVTVYLDSAQYVERVEQEVEVDLPAGVEHGHALRMALENEPRAGE